MAATCTYEARSRYSCSESPVIGFSYCVTHLQTPRGLVHAQDVIREGALFTVADLEGEIARRTAPPDTDYHTSALEKMDQTLTAVLEWEKDAKAKLDALDTDEWRYQDRTRQEQVRSEVLIYERALDRSSRVLREVSKMALSEKIVSLGRAQTELIIRILMRVIENLKLSDELFNSARQDLLRAFQEEANLASTVEHEVTKELTTPVHASWNVEDAEVVNERAS